MAASIAECSRCARALRHGMHRRRDVDVLDALAVERGPWVVWAKGPVSGSRFNQRFVRTPATSVTEVPFGIGRPSGIQIRRRLAGLLQYVSGAFLAPFPFVASNGHEFAGRVSVFGREYPPSRWSNEHGHLDRTTRVGLR